MDLFSRFSSTLIVEDGILCTALNEFEMIWISQFWAPEAVQGGHAVSHERVCRGTQII